MVKGQLFGLAFHRQAARDMHWAPLGPHGPTPARSDRKTVFSHPCNLTPRTTAHRKIF